MLLAQLLRPFHFRGKARLLHSLSPRSGERTASIFGYRAQLAMQNYIERSIFLGVFEPEETRRASAYLKPGHVFVDAGANVGYYTLLAARKVGPEGRVYAFEPSPYPAGKLKEIIAANRITNVTLLERALGDAEGEAAIYLPPTNNNYTPSMVKNDNTIPHIVRIETLDGFMARHDVPRIDLLKMDVEGFEPNILRGAAHALRDGKIRAVLCEFNEHWLIRNQSSSARLFDSLCAAGFAPVNQKFDAHAAMQTLLLVRR